MPEQPITEFRLPCGQQARKYTQTAKTGPWCSVREGLKYLMLEIIFSKKAILYLKSLLSAPAS